MYNAIFHPCQHFTLPATKAQTNISTKHMQIEMPSCAMTCKEHKGMFLPVNNKNMSHNKKAVWLCNILQRPPTWKMRSQF